MKFIKPFALLLSAFVTQAYNYCIVMLPTHQSDIIESIAHNVSNPLHPNYGKYLSKAEVDEIVSNEIIRTPWLSWFANHSINYTDIGDAFVLHQHIEKNMIPVELKSTAFHILEINNSSHTQTRRPIIHKHPNDNPGISPRTSLNALYNIPDTFITHPKVSQSVIEFQSDASFSVDDATTFTNSTNLPPINYTRIGPFGGVDGEATLDIQIQIAVGRGAIQYYITTSGWLYEATTLLLALENPPLVNSMSWGWNAHDQCSISPCGNMTSIQYINRVNKEFAKLAARGITMLASSGDSGAYGRTNEDCDNSASALRPVFPTSSPWVTSVGGTVIVNSILLPQNKAITPLCKEKNCIVGGNETICHFNITGWTSGGGISWDFPMPPWQKDVANAYYHSKVNLPPSDYYNRSGRIYPDVSLVANDYLIYLNGEWQYLGGTSASCPAFSGMISQWNNARLNRNQPVVGNVNQMLYHLSKTCKKCFTNVVTGTNDATEMNTCNTGWYSASSARFDPVYGLGLPNIGEIIKH